MGVGGIVLSADGVVGAEHAPFQGAVQVLVDLPPDLDEPAQGALRVHGAGVEQDGRPDGGHG